MCGGSISARLATTFQHNKEELLTRFGFLAGGALLSMVLLAACETAVRATPTSTARPLSAASPTSAPTLPPTSTLIPAVLTAALVPPQVTNTQQITIEGTDRLTFVPDTLTVTAGQTVELTLVNSGQLDHTFTVPDLSIEVQMPAGKTNTFTFMAPQAGVYRFNSGVITEFDSMKGKLIVK